MYNNLILLMFKKRFILLKLVITFMVGRSKGLNVVGRSKGLNVVGRSKGLKLKPSRTPLVSIIGLHRTKKHDLLHRKLMNLSILDLTKLICDLKSKGNVGGDILDVHSHEELLQVISGIKFIKEVELRKKEKK
jgi:hypothetical protein